MKEKEQTNNELQQRCIGMESQLSASKKEAKDCLNEHDVVLKANFNIAQELRRVNGELKVGGKTYTVCIEKCNCRKSAPKFDFSFTPVVQLSSFVKPFHYD